MALIYLRHTSHSNSSMKSHWYTDGLHLNRGGRRLKGKMANLRVVVTRKQSMPSFPKNKHVLPHDTYT